jgi:hypothetical protein
MRTIGVAAFTVALVVSPVERGGAAQSPGLQGSIVFAPNAGRIVTIFKNGALRASFNIPTGTFLSASYDDKQPTSLAPSRWEFHGDFVLRAQSRSEMPAPGGGIAQRLSNAPLVLSVQGMDVVIEDSQ